MFSRDFGSLHCLHCITPGQTVPMVRAAKVQGAYFKMVKDVDSPGVAIDVKAIEPRTLTITRFVNERWDSAQDCDTWTDDMFLRGAREVIQQVFDRTNLDERRAADFFEVLNEADPPGVAGWRALGRFCCEVVREADRRGLKILLPAFNAGTPEWDEMQAFVESGLFALLKAGGHLLSIHEGVFGKVPMDFGLGDRIPGAPAVEGAGSMIGRYKYLYHLLKQRDEVVPCVVTELYTGDYYSLPPEQQGPRLVWADRFYRADPNVWGIMGFTVDPGINWLHQNYTETYVKFVLPYIVAERDVPNPTRPSPVPTPPPPPPIPVPPAPRCLVGLHGRADGRMQPSDFEAVRVARIEAVKLLSTAAPEDVDSLRAIRPDLFVMVRMFAQFVGRRVTAAEFAGWMVGDLWPFYERGVRDFEVHNEPNLNAEGLESSWANGTEFAAWFLEVVRLLRPVFPDARFGFPGLSPGPSIQTIRQDALVFLDQARAAVAAADWAACHCYWQTEAGQAERTGGRSYLDYLERFPDRPLYITEFSNTDPFVGKAVKAQQYVRYYESLRHVPNLRAAFAFVCSASQGYRPETWRDEQGQLSPIPAMVGARIEPPAPPPSGEIDMKIEDLQQIADSAQKIAASSNVIEDEALKIKVITDQYLGWWNAWPDGVYPGDGRPLAIPNKVMIFYRRDGTPFTPQPPQVAGKVINWTMWVVEKRGSLLKVYAPPPGEDNDWWVRAQDVQPAA